MSQMTQSTNAFSEGYVERYLPLRTADPPDPRTHWKSELDGVLTSATDRPYQVIHDLDTEALSYMLLILPTSMETFRASDGKWVTVYSKSGSSSCRIPTRCLMVSHFGHASHFEIQSPMQCDILYDDTGGSVQITNRSVEPLQLQSLAKQDLCGIQHEKYVLDQWRVATISSGFWKFISGPSHVIHIEICPRKPPSILLRHHPLKSCIEQISVAQHLVVVDHEQPKSLRSLLELEDGETARVSRASGDFFISRIRKTSDTPAARLFEARHSAYPRRVIIVKVLRNYPKISMASRLRVWHREFETHRQLASVSKRRSVRLVRPFITSDRNT